MLIKKIKKKGGDFFLDRKMKFNKFITYQDLTLRGYDIGIVTAKKAFIFVTVDQLRVQFNN